ncbi:MAG: ATP-dependent zinc metalloprotease FtsH [Lachnospiraceae bacterium]|nr:ATP-dependent zinc metalloprotease FtsH [Lachnospiraceae bacterium]MBQ6197518.1 ATP-dependent zinc metalloprotease FtsH [Lachnospiraceae bacterium]
MNNKKNDDDKNKRPKWIRMLIAALVAMIALSFLSRSLLAGMTGSLTYSEFLKILETENVKSVTFNEYYNKISATVTDASGREKVYTTGIVDKEAALEIINERNIPYSGTVIQSSSWFSIIMYAIFIGFLLYSMRSMRNGGGLLGNFGQNNAKMYVQKETGVSFADVAGQEEAKESMQEIVEFLHDPGRYAEIGAKLPKGALLVGPPGTGKTLLAKAVAGEAKVPFFSLAGSDFVEMFVGMGASRVRSLFKDAQQMAPCIIFIDEIDAIGKSRDSRYGGNDEREQTLNALLAEMDGFDSSKGVFILAATNRPEVLDPALCRPGRLDRRIIVDKPDLKGRIAVLKVHAKHVNIDESVDFNEIALATSGAVGSDLANMVNEAAILAVKKGRNYVTQSDLLESVEVVIAGKEKKDRVMNDKEKRTVAYHEVGHALATALQKHTEPVQKITIVPRTMGSLGYVMQTPEEEKYLMTKDELDAELVTLLAGRASEEIFFDSVSTGASNDIEKATKLARSMVTRFGMSEEFGLMGLETIDSEYLTARSYMNCADETSAKVDMVVKKMLQEAYAKAKELLSANKDIMHKIAAYLIKKETITGKEFMQLMDEAKKERDEAEAALRERFPELIGAKPQQEAPAAETPDAAADSGEEASAEAGHNDPEAE